MNPAENSLPAELEPTRPSIPLKESGPAAPSGEPAGADGEEKKTQKPWYLRYLPLGLFVGGFLFDLLTLSREVTSLNLTVIGLYGFSVAAGLWLKSGVIRLPLKVRRFVHLAIHFSLGSFFSALVVLYFRSAGHIGTFLVVMLLFLAMLWNEFAHRDNSQAELLWAIFSASLVMYFNFLFPHLFASISPWWFYGSTFLALAALLALRSAARQPWTTLRLAGIGAALIVALYQLGWIPPVPLVIESRLVGAEFSRENGDYTAMVHQPTLLDRLRLGPPVVERHVGEAVYVLTAVSAPPGAETSLEHRWSRRVDGQWVQTDAIPIRIRGGRKEGWRFYSFKRNLSPGDWKVETALVDGAILGHQRFHLRDVPLEEEIPRQRQAL